jgi:hypothetical protein
MTYGHPELSGWEEVGGTGNFGITVTLCLLRWSLLTRLVMIRLFAAAPHICNRRWVRPKDGPFATCTTTV